ncbi:hypothetical protein EI94DRAFT_472730 [Lactarius quietus]|nr:hypothetical protein EI94DRAFT_472730 [Lactarius quietus]
MNSRRPKSKGTHCFDIPVPKFLDNRSACTLDLRCNSLTVGHDASPASFHADARQRMITLLITAGPNPTGVRRQEQCEMHAKASALLAWTKKHPAPPNACMAIPWSVWGPAGARVVEPRIDDATRCASKSRLLGSGMRVISPPSSRGDGTSVVTVTDYHPARVFRGLRAEKKRQHNGHGSPIQMQGMPAHADGSERNNKPARDR